MKVNKTFQYKVVHPNDGKTLSLNRTTRQYRKCVNFYLHEIVKGTELKEIYQEARETMNFHLLLFRLLGTLLRNN